MIAYLLRNNYLFYNEEMGFQIRTFSIVENPYLRIDENKVKLDYLGDLPDVSIKSTYVRVSYSNHRRRSYSEQLDDLNQQLDELDNTLNTKLRLSSQVLSNDQSLKIEKLENKIKNLENDITKNKIISTLQKQNKKLTSIEKKLHRSTITENNLLNTSLDERYCIKRKIKRKIINLFNLTVCEITFVLSATLD